MKFHLSIALAALCVLPLHWAFGQVPPEPIPTPAPTAAPTPLPGTAPTPIQDPKKDDTPGEMPKGAGTETVNATPLPKGPTPTPTPKTIEDLTKGYEKDEGVFTIYRKIENNKQKFFAEIKESQIGPMFLLQSTFASGNAGRAVAGRPADDTIWKWERTPDDRLVVVAPNIWYRAKDPNLKVAVERDFPEAYLSVFSILAKDEKKKTLLIDIAPFFDGKIPGLNTAFSGGALAALTSAGNYVPDPELSYIEKFKNFPQNIVVESLFHYRRVGDSGGSQTQADARSLPIRVVFNVYPLEDNSYRPRMADPRIGYFINGQLSAGRTGFESFDDEPSKDPRVYYINRWNLQKSNPTAKMSAPVKPVVFYLDSSVPVRYRPFMRAGILNWNKAFEAIGIKGAIEVRDAPANDNSDYDHADMRFNTLRWVASPPTESGAYAVAQMRENPLTGEIINASITVNANFARIAYREKNQVVDPVIGHNSNMVCEIGEGAMENAARGLEVMQSVDPRFSDQKYVDALLQGLVVHEFGHVLGLRHNFLGSMFLTPQQLADPKAVAAYGVSSTAMDYVGFNLFGLRSGAALFTSGPGRYDFWAIRYGYQNVAGATPIAEKPALSKIASLNGQSGLVYYGDEMADDYDPTNVRYDLSSDPLAYAEKSLGLTNYLLQTLDKREPKTAKATPISPDACVIWCAQLKTTPTSSRASSAATACAAWSKATNRKWIRSCRFPSTSNAARWLCCKNTFSRPTPITSPRAISIKPRPTRSRWTTPAPIARFRYATKWRACAARF